MAKTLLNTIKVLLVSACLMMPVAVSAQDIQQHNPTIETDATQPSVVASSFNLRIKNAEGLILEVFSVTGQKVFTQKIESPSRSIDFSGTLQRGYYIVRLGKLTRKIYIG